MIVCFFRGQSILGFVGQAFLNERFAFAADKMFVGCFIREVDFVGCVDDNVLVVDSLLADAVAEGFSAVEKLEENDTQRPDV